MSIDHASALEAAVSETGVTTSARTTEWGGTIRGPEFLSTTDRTGRCRELADEGYLVARVVPTFDASSDDAPPSVRRAELRNALEGAVEISLALRGALPPAVELGAPVRESVIDQVFRLRKLGAPGLCIVLPSLGRLADDDGELSAEDSAALEAWRLMAIEHPVVLLFDDEDQDVVMLAPRPLSEVFPTSRLTPTSWPDDARSLLDQTPTQKAAVAVELEAEVAEGWDDNKEDAPLEEVLAGDAATEPEVEAHPDRVALTDALAAPELQDEYRAALDAAELEDELDAERVHSSVYDAPTRPGKRLDRVIARDPLAGLDLDEDSEDSVREPIRRAMFDAASSAAASPFAPSSLGARCSEPSRDASVDGSFSAAGRASVGVSHDAMSSHEAISISEGLVPARRRPLSPRFSPDDITRLCNQLKAAEGPKPVSAIQDLFTSCYTPLLEALSNGYGDADVERVVDDWRESFEKSYSEGFNTMRVTGRRPSMVLDAPEIATKIAKLNGARAAQLLLVDGMRYDLGLRVHRELTHLMEGTAICVDRPVLWSALPSTTPVQMHLLARGPRALKEDIKNSEREPQIHRDGSLTTLRRVRIGQRDLVKLDIVEARLREAGPGFESRMSSLAEEVADVIASYAEGLPPRTLLFIFGDHGFYMPTGGANATGPADQGNATPEEVLIGAQAWMTGAIN